MNEDEPISWMALEEGTDVLSSDGETVGKVSKVVADVQKDIFSGVAFRHNLLSSQRFAPADLVKEITPEAVHLTVSKEAAEELEHYER